MSEDALAPSNTYFVAHATWYYRTSRPRMGSWDLVSQCGAAYQKLEAKVRQGEDPGSDSHGGAGPS